MQYDKPVIDVRLCERYKCRNYVSLICGSCVRPSSVDGCKALRRENRVIVYSALIIDSVGTTIPHSFHCD